MREVIADLFACPADAIVIPVNWVTKRNGEAVMGAGVAKEAARRWPWLPKELGRFIHGTSIRQPRIYRDLTLAADGGPVILAYATKWHWRDPSSLPLIEANAERLARGADLQGWQAVVLPRLGCGLGGLAWPDVRAVLAPLLDDRFAIVSQQPGPSAGIEGESR